MSSLMPLRSRLLLKLDKTPRSFAGGELIIAHVPDVNQGRYYRHFPKRGEVLAAGPEVQDVAVGDYVLCTTFNGVDVPRVFGDDLLLIKEEFVLVITDKPGSLDFGRVLEQWPGGRDSSLDTDVRELEGSDDGR